MRIKVAAGLLAVSLAAATPSLGETGEGGGPSSDPIGAGDLAPVTDVHPLVRDVLAAHPDLDVVICLAGCPLRPGQVVYARPKPSKLAAVPSVPPAPPVPAKPAAVAPAVPKPAVVPLAPAPQKAWVAGDARLALAEALAAGGPAPSAVVAVQVPRTRVWVSGSARLELVAAITEQGTRVGYITLASY